VADLKKEGKVRWIGVSNFNVQQLRRAKKIAPITSLQPPYSLIYREVEEDILPYCLREGFGVIVYWPMASGLLTGAMTRERFPICRKTTDAARIPISRSHNFLAT
jgi:aryl-alcohol dehydrogenase-like predicted oxidoreductase